MTPETYSVFLVFSDEDEAFLASVQELPGCWAHGETRAEALQQIEIAIRNWVDTAREDRREVPSPHHYSNYEELREQKVREELAKLLAETLKQISVILSVRPSSLVHPKIVKSKEAEPQASVR